MLENKKVTLLEEFTRFGGGQTVFESVYSFLKSESTEIKVVTDKKHDYLPKYVPAQNIIGTRLVDPNWDRPVLLFPRILSLKRELKQVVPEGLTFNNHPNVFVFNASINFWHEVFGFMVQRPGRTDKIALSVLKRTGLFKEYNNAYFLTNGKFTERQIREALSYLGVTNLVIEHIDLPVKIPEKISFGEKERIVLTFGRISPDKNLEKALEIAQSVKTVKFVIAGSVLEKERWYIEKLESRKPGNVTIIQNPSFQIKDSLYRRAKVYLHTKKNENYGISVAEAISYGCYPVVPRDGGAYEDLLMEGAIGYSFSDGEEAAQFILQAIEAQASALEDILSTRERFAQEKFSSSLRESFSRFI